MLQTIQNSINELAKNKHNLAVNIHLTGKCDMQCIGCYARFGEDVKSKPFSLTQSDWVQVIDNIYKYTSGLNVKINFVGGEPLLYPHLPYLLEHTKNRGFTTSIVTNGSLLRRRFAELNGLLDWVGISIDSFNENTLRKLGRVTKNKTLNYHEIVPLIHDLNSKLKVNTVISQHNWQEKMTHELMPMKIDRWKVFQFLPVVGENDSAVSALSINEDQFRYFYQQHATLKPVIENNDEMRGSYLMISPEGRVFDNANGHYSYGASLLENNNQFDAGGDGFSTIKFLKRGGSYDWQTKFQIESMK
ncbi:MAG: viperin family antiviral radical SAM protein [Methylotenera sp.]|nr:viperin family antiviral radical SAM protein [Methylotenera sp.]